jgi:hypothetical protein
MPHRPLLREALVAAAYLALTGCATYPLLGGFASSIQSGGDTWLGYWDLWWVRRALVDLHTNPFFSRDLYFPYGAPLYFHSLNFLQGLLAIPVGSAVGPTSAYNAVVFGSFVASGYFTYRLALYVIRHDIGVPAVDGTASAVRFAAFTGGVVFAFSSYRLAHLSHLELLSTQWLPLFALFLLKTGREACGSRIRCQAATGSWTRSWQWETHRTRLRSVEATTCPPSKVSGVWPSNEAWERAAL